MNDPAVNPSIAPHRSSADDERINEPARNPGVAFDGAWIEEIHVNRSAAERRAETLVTRRTVKKAWQAAWLLRAISCLDLTTLAGDDTEGRVRRLCAKARQPVHPDLMTALGMTDLRLTVGAVCVYHAMIDTALKALEGSGVPVAAVSAGFPAGQAPFSTRVQEIRDSVAAGAQEIDIVISRRHVLHADWPALYDEVTAFRSACGEAHMKAIVATGDLGNLTRAGKASLVCMMAGADFVKTSTGMEPVNATLPASLAMVRMVREYHQHTGYQVGFKPAGGISTAKDALHYLILMKEELGPPWLDSRLFRIGASRLLGDIERQLEHYVTGRYSAASRHPMG